MARLVKMERTGPIRIEIGGVIKSICGCGLTNNPPYCDGSHKQCHDEEEGKTYIYENGERREV